MKKYDLAVYIGRFQPFHNGHKYVIEEAQKIAKDVLVLIGSANASPSCKNPFTIDTRASMVRKSTSKVIVDYLDDFTYEENQWIAEVQELVAEHSCKNSKICLIGYDKDETSYYLKNFPQWKVETVDYFEVIDATQIRDLMFQGKLSFISGAVPEKVLDAIVDWYNKSTRVDLLEEYLFIKDYKEAWAGSPYPPTFQTVDAVVVQSGHVLLVERGELPGKGLWAMPGGFIQENERLIDACIRELREETKLKIPEPVLRGSIVKKETFDHPGRSQRGRTITRAFLIQLDDSQELPKVKGNDDAKHAKWVPLVDFYNMPEKMYEDHYHIVRKLVDNM